VQISKLELQEIRQSPVEILYSLDDFKKCFS
jgi:hypothetical protein